MKSGEYHYHNDCSMSKHTKDLACCNCGGHHTANYSKCPHFPKTKTKGLTTVKKFSLYISDVHEFSIISKKIRGAKNESSQFLDGNLQLCGNTVFIVISPNRTQALSTTRVQLAKTGESLIWVIPMLKRSVVSHMKMRLITEKNLKISIFHIICNFHMLINSAPEAKKGALTDMAADYR